MLSPRLATYNTSSITNAVTAVEPSFHTGDLSEHQNILWGKIDISIHITHNNYSLWETVLWVPRIPSGFDTFPKTLIWTQMLTRRLFPLARYKLLIYPVRCFTGHFLQIHDRRILFYIIYSLDMTTIINEHIFSVFR